MRRLCVGISFFILLTSLMFGWWFIVVVIAMLLALLGWSFFPVLLAMLVDGYFGMWYSIPMLTISVLLSVAIVRLVQPRLYH